MTGVDGGEGEEKQGDEEVKVEYLVSKADLFTEDDFPRKTGKAE